MFRRPPNPKVLTEFFQKQKAVNDVYIKRNVSHQQQQQQKHQHESHQNWNQEERFRQFQGEHNPFIGRYKTNQLNYRTIIAGGASVAALTLLYELMSQRSFEKQMQKKLEPTENDDTELYTTHVIKHEHMFGTHANDIPDDAEYLLGFATKDGFADILGSSSSLAITHSSVVLLDVHAKSEAKFLVIGRQSPYFENPEHAEKRPLHDQKHKSHHPELKSEQQPAPTPSEKKSTWMFGSALKAIGTSMENEKNYELFPDSPIHGVVLHNVKVTGKEMKQAFAEANERICQEQFCTMATSNCYSGSVFTLCRVMHIIANRSNVSESQKDHDLARLWRLIQERATDNLGLGVRNNALLKKEFDAVRKMLAKRPGLKEAPKPSNHMFSSSFPSHKKIKEVVKQDNKVKTDNTVKPEDPIAQAVKGGRIK